MDTHTINKELPIINQSDTFDTWWHKEGSRMSNYVSENTKETTRRIAHIAWLNGEYNAHICKQNKK